MAAPESRPPAQAFFRSTMATGASITFVVRVYGAALAYLTQIFLARTMGAEELGVFVFAWTTISLVAFLAPLGFDNALVRFLAGYVGEQNWSAASGALRLGYQTTLAISVAVAVVAISLILLSGATTEPYRLVLLIAFASLPLLALMNLHEGIARGFSWIYQVGMPSYAVRPTLFICLLFAAWFLGAQLSSALVASLMVAAVALTFGWQYLRYRRLLNPNIRKAVPSYRSRYWMATAFPMVLVVSFEQLLANTDIVMLGVLEGPGATGVYNIAVRIVGIALFVFFAVSAFAAPRIAELYSAGKRLEVVRLAQKVRAAIAFPTMVGLLILVLFAEPILAVFGLEFLQAKVPMLILCIPVAARALAGPIDNLLTMTGKQAALSRVLATTAVINIVANATLIPLFGITGAACATSACVVLELVWVSRLVARHIGYRSWKPFQKIEV